MLANFGLSLVSHATSSLIWQKTLRDNNKKILQGVNRKTNITGDNRKKKLHE
jgi:hypothetical protein